ncbi:uncharacterized protein PV09_03328 [Verruconis gallopava]|uniref:Protein SYM1 n=1 Tax=Verruconis gallopava TaxID=253628 RepID=A0A0D2B2C5_9PEZI|nr:uncharacterized protein PV09_03328 [Verruconis gallopava]KIW05439.1 hypothetical protein PV09_03328 [Verruconis gallopava]
MISSGLIGRASLAYRLSRRCQLHPPFSHSKTRSHSTLRQTTSAETTEASKIAPATTSEKSIPGPIWAWTESLNSYTRMHARRPHTVQLVSTLIIYLVGDLTAQSIAPTPQENDGDTAWRVSWYDLPRTGRALLIGGLAAIPGYHWFLFLSRNFNYSSKAGSIALKVLINQTFFTPIFNTYFFGMQSLLSGAGWDDIVKRVEHTVPRSWYNSWKLWPAVTAFSFAFIKLELRGLFAGVIAIGWQTYLSILNQRAARLEVTMKGESDSVTNVGKPQHA